MDVILRKPSRYFREQTARKLNSSILSGIHRTNKWASTFYLMVTMDIGSAWLHTVSVSWSIKLWNHSNSPEPCIIYNTLDHILCVHRIRTKGSLLAEFGELFTLVGERLVINDMPM
uniref:Uncharacterized protein n=1 Tax=Cacopsylla melanoneura TaxID=428564 RepID=A0A8D9FG15_9HEMI